MRLKFIQEEIKKEVHDAKNQVLSNNIIRGIRAGSLRPGGKPYTPINIATS
jgi:2',3'-cyclic-nucleotide 2'-phosphodiesterase (5'-nucleotidase family)